MFQPGQEGFAQLLFRNGRDISGDPYKLRAGVEMIADRERQEKLRKFKMIPETLGTGGFGQRIAETLLITVPPVPIPGESAGNQVKHREPQCFVRLNKVHLVENIGTPSRVRMQ